MISSLKQDSVWNNDKNRLFVQIFFFSFGGRSKSHNYLASVYGTVTLKSGLEQRGQTVLNF